MNETVLPQTQRLEADLFPYKLMGGREKYCRFSAFCPARLVVDREFRNTTGGSVKSLLFPQFCVPHLNQLLPSKTG